jgi:hypothetical protein
MGVARSKGSRVMRTSTAFFAGVGTVVVAIAAGLGGGLTIANIMSPHSPKLGAETTRLERRISGEPIPAANAPAEPVPYLAATQPPQTQPQPGAANAASAAAQPAEPTAAAEVAAKPPEAPALQPPAPTAPAAPQQQAAAPENASGKARNADQMQVAEKRKAERRQQWADRRRHQRREDEVQRDVEQHDVEQKVREEIELPYIVEPPVRVGMPRIRLFGSDNED